MSIQANREPYRFGFVLSTTIGNRTHYQNLKKFAELDPEVDSWWTPVDHRASPRAQKWLRFLPGAVAIRVWVLYQLWPGLQRLRGSDAVMVHQFEGELLLTLRSYLPRSPVLVSSTDEAPALGLENYPTYPAHRNKSPLRRAFRLALDRWRARRVDCLIPFTRWAAELYRKVERVSDEKIIPIHVGLDLTLWAFRDRSRPDHEAPKILFVGADFQRKGGDLLLEVFRKGFASSTELHLVTGHTPSDLPSNVFLHQDLVPNDERLVALYRSCTMLVMPTTADLAPWVFIEAMATGCPVIGTNVGAISEIIDDGVTGFVIPVGDAEALNVRMHHLLDHPNIAREMGRQGRLKVEREFDASRNVPKILKAMKLTVERRKRLGTAARA